MWFQASFQSSGIHYPAIVASLSIWQPAVECYGGKRDFVDQQELQTRQNTNSNLSQWHTRHRQSIKVQLANRLIKNKQATREEPDSGTCWWALGSRYRVWLLGKVRKEKMNKKKKIRKTRPPRFLLCRSQLVTIVQPVSQQALTHVLVRGVHLGLVFNRPAALSQCLQDQTSRRRHYDVVASAAACYSCRCWAEF